LIHIVDYGLGNVGAFLELYNRLNIAAMPARTMEELQGADHIILPGVGAFDHAMALLDASGMRPKLDELVLVRKVPVLGVCVGMQIIGDNSEEGNSSGLGWIKGTIRSLARRSQHIGLPLPHMGWNDVHETRPLVLLDGIKTPRFYFLHSFYFDNVRFEDGAANVNYGHDFTCIINHENIWGVQFHPEKSHHFGSEFLKNFAEI
jgi:imidazole glycerol-phosphate synthase subunit HisH